jgi:hypothetical protein
MRVDDISLWTSRAMRVFLQRSQGDFVGVWCRDTAAQLIHGVNRFVQGLHVPR